MFILIAPTIFIFVLCHEGGNLAWYWSALAASMWPLLCLSGD